MYSFIWDSKPDKVKRKLIQNYSKGGLKMLDIDLFINSLKCSWIKRLFDENNLGQWKLFYLNKINKLGGKIVFESNLDEQKATELFPKNKFLQDIIISWVKINKENTHINGGIGKQIYGTLRIYS